MTIGYGSWAEVKQAIKDKTEELLAIGDEKGVEELSFGFEVNYELMPIVTCKVRRAMVKEARDDNQRNAR